MAPLTEVCPLSEELALLAENLNPGIVPVGDVDSTSGVPGDGMRQAELSRLASQFAPSADELSLRIANDDAIVAIPVGNKNFARRRFHHVGRHLQAPVIFTWFAGDTDGQ